MISASFNPEFTLHHHGRLNVLAFQHQPAQRASRAYRACLLAFVVTALASAWQPAQAAATADEITREALLKGYTRQDAERRYKESTSLTRPGASQPAGNALASGLGALAANAERRMQASRTQDDLFWAKLDFDLDYPFDTVGEVEAFKGLLARNTEGWGNSYNIHARRRKIEFALHLREHSQHFFARRDEAEAARLLRLNAYSRTEFYPWSALTLAKLYLSGRGVPKDEGEARHLVDLCASQPSTPFDNTTADNVGCMVLLSKMHRNGWGGVVDTDAAVAALKQARLRLPAARQTALSDDEMLALYR